MKVLGGVLGVLLVHLVDASSIVDVSSIGDVPQAAQPLLPWENFVVKLDSALESEHESGTNDGQTPQKSPPAPLEGLDLFMDSLVHSGYIPVGSSGGEMFYICSPAEIPEGLPASAEARIPVIIWLTGGPGCASEIAMFTENGPFKLLPNGTISRNEHNWSKLAHVIYVDQPLGTGYSKIGSWVDYATDEETIAQYLRQAVSGIAGAHPPIRNRQLFIFGESYAGHYIPPFARLLIEQPIPTLPLAGVALGNAWVDPITQFPSQATFSRLTGIAPENDLIAAENAFEVCKELIRLGKWSVALVECSNSGGHLLGNLSPYDVRQKCEFPPLCYDMAPINAFLNDPRVTARLGARSEWQACSKSVRYFLLDDWIFSAKSAVVDLLESGIPVMAYNGDQDFVCNWIGTWEMLNSLEWSGAKSWKKAKPIDFIVDGKPMGYSVSDGPLSFFVIKDSGHMVPMDQPKAAFELVKHFLNRHSVSSPQNIIDS